jgi:cyclic pyranopterin phosphate synthase
MLVERIEVHVVAHCNLRCRGCNHASPDLAREFVEPEAIREDLAHAVRLGLRSNVLRLLGGEPLLHPKLAEIIRIAREAGISKKIHVVTNGVLLDRKPPELWNEVDLIVVSLYPGVSINVPEQIKGKLKINEISHFRETFSTVRNSDDKSVEEIWDRCEIRNYCHGVVNGYFYKCMRAPYISRMLKLTDKDGIALDSTTPEMLDSYIADEKPLDACHYCTGTCGKSFAHEQVAGKEWLAWQSRPVAEMIAAEQSSIA